MSIPFWPQPNTPYAGVLPARADVLVIGGGITGVSLLHHLARRGMSAVLVERHHLAAGASGRNAGFLLAGVAENYAAAVHRFGRSKAREIWALTVENHERQIEAVGRAYVGHRRLGSLTLAASDEEARELEESCELLRKDGFEATWDGHGLVNPRDGEVDPSQLVRALAGTAQNGTILEGVDVSAIDGTTVLSGDKSCQAGVVILATNGFTSQLVPSIAIQPTRAQMLATEPWSSRVAELPTYSHHGYRYWRQLPGGELLIGGWRDTSMETEATSDAEPTPAIQARLEAAVRGLGVEAAVTHRWAGTMGFTESGLPLVGPVEGMKNVYACAGFNGHGMGFAFMSAKSLVDSL
jgi:gamma-glutamylputrescine oxidase